MPATVATLTAEGRGNSLAAVSKYDGERLRVTGVVQSTGINNVTRRYADHMADSALPFASRSIERTENVPYPYLILVDPQLPDQGAVVCYFRREDLEELSGTQRGSLVTVEGQFQQFATTAQGRFETVLNYCEIG